MSPQTLPSTHRAIQLRIALVSVLALSVFCAGCPFLPPAAPPRDFSELTEDADRDGFPELPTHSLTAAEDDVSMRMRLVNELDQSDVRDMAARNGFDPALVSLVDVRIEAEISLEYEDGAIQRLSEHRSITPFDIRAEGDCPTVVTATITIAGQAPVVGRLKLIRLVETFERGEFFECGDTLEARGFIGEDGLFHFVYERLDSEDSTPHDDSPYVDDRIEWWEE